jgi:hypothetical protein
MHQIGCDETQQVKQQHDNRCIDPDVDFKRILSDMKLKQHNGSLLLGFNYCSQQGM